MNYLIDINIIIDNYNDERSRKFSESVEFFSYALEQDNIFISSSSFDNIAYILADYMRKDFGYTLNQRKFLASKVIKFLSENFKIAKTPSYLEIDYNDIEDSQIIASAKAIDAKVITRDKVMLEKYSDITISTKDFLKTINNIQKTNIDFANLKKQHFMYEAEISQAMDGVLNNTSFIMGEPVKTLEKNLQEFTGAKHAITCSSGTDALLLAMMALDIQPGDEIITTPFTFIATAETIAFLKAKPVFVDIDEKTYNIDPSKIEEKITDKTKAIIPVSLYGQPADMDAIQAIADKHNLKVIIDGAQSFGSTYKGKTDSNLGDISTTSFFPAKPLGCYGDGGAVFTNDDALAEKMRSLRVHGQSKRYHHKYIGMGGRLDTIQAAVLNVKLKHYKKDLALRQEVAQKYKNQFKIQNLKLITPIVKDDRTSAWAQYSIRVKNRDELQAKLKEKGIPTAVHYPMPLHLQECFEYLGYKEGDFPISEKVSKEILSLPMNPYLKEDEIVFIVKKVLEFDN
jgi:UDP-2-acetamido-2-deoxy-ribo-hexuluronate aminotransferase